MEEALKIAGNTAAHAIWSVSDGEQLIPLIAETDLTGKTTQIRCMGIQPDQIDDFFLKKSNALGKDYNGLSLVQDSIVTLEKGKTDALLIDVRMSYPENSSVQLCIPYRHAKHEKGFAIHRLKITGITGISPDKQEAITNAFFDGIESHQQGSLLWKEKYEDEVMEDQIIENEVAILSSELEALQKSPFLIFFLVAAADGKVDKKEVQEFIEILSNPEILQNELMAQLISGVGSKIPSIISEMATGKKNYIEELSSLKEIIDSKLAPEYANDFKITLLRIGKKIAESSGGFFGFGSKISKEEKTALAGIAICLGINFG